MAQKYQFLLKIYGSNLYSIPSRVLKFKKTKWAALRAILQEKIKKNSLENSSSLISEKVRFPIGFKSNDNLLALYLSMIPVPVSAPDLFSDEDKAEEEVIEEFLDENQEVKISDSDIKVIDKFQVFGNQGKFVYLSSMPKNSLESRIRLRYLLNQRKMLTPGQCKERDLYVKTIYKDLFGLKGVLSSVYFFNYLHEIKHSAKSNVIFVNDRKLGCYRNLIQGDIVKIKTLTLSLRKNIDAIYFNDCVPSHLEVDFYSQSIILVKDFNTVLEEDYYLNTFEYMDIQKM